MSSSAPRAFTMQELNRLLVRALPDEYRVRPALPLRLGEGCEPWPDLAVVSAAASERRIVHPDAALLVVEVVGGSSRRDRAAKALYARAFVPEHWVVDVDALVVEVSCDPDVDAARYRVVSRLGMDGVLRATSVPLPPILVMDVMP